MTQTVLKNEVTELSPDKGIRTETRRAVADSLGNALADAFRLYFNVQTLHWNVEGPMFYSLHKLTEEQYAELNESVDTIAERIRALGLPALQTMSEFSDRTEIDDLPTSGDLKGRIARLVKDYETAGLRLQKIIKLAEEAGDIKTADLLTEQLGRYDENAWMLRATIAQ
ncbi:MAG: Dps family protein [Woeseiaceae bacterium]|nr:Dps family protein [Woeseiaceae bacterium]